MKKTISHSFEDETLEAKTYWFKTLSPKERLEMLSWFTDLALMGNPKIMEQKDAQPIAGRVLVLSKTPS
ncbi:MAG: hypothetical protein B6I38_03030 [Anaerolineaceae bacterium 4572_5.1]|nr:MAG: hypothetical protein B6I38_03030 [Anaerolineaceae bacterium 4572_5.1]